METSRPPKVEILVDQAGGDLVFRRRTGSSVVGGFLLLWLPGGIGMGVWVAGAMRRDPSLEYAFMAAPFVAVWVFFSYGAITTLIGFERLEVGPDGLKHGTLTTRRLVPLEEIRGVAQSRKVVNDETGMTVHGLIVRTLGQPVRFGQGLDEGELASLVDRLLDHLRALAPARAIESHPGGDAKPGVVIEVLRPERSIPGPPSDCSLRSQAGWDGTEFVRRGNFSFIKLGAVTLLNLFWNGILGVFLVQLSRKFEWSLFLFLIPFEAIGLVLCAFWLFVLLAPFWAERWVIGPGESTARASLLGLGRTRRFEAQELGRVELRKAGPDEQGGESDIPYSLGFVGRDGRDLMALEGLTEGEARWVGGVACDVLRGSLPKDGGLPPATREGPAPLWDREIDS